MTCDICKEHKLGLAWVSSASGSYVICSDCAQPLQRALSARVERLRRFDSLEPLLNEFLTSALEVTHADMGNIQLVDADRALRIRAQIGFEREFLDFFECVRDNEAACGTAAASRRTIVVSDVDRSPIFMGSAALDVLHNAGVRAVQSTPMFSRSEELIGVVSTHFRLPHIFASHEIDLVGHLAAEAAHLIEDLSTLRT